MTVAEIAKRARRIAKIRRIDMARRTAAAIHTTDKSAGIEGVARQLALKEKKR